jgi:hypothetical protein
VSREISLSVQMSKPSPIVLFLLIVLAVPSFTCSGKEYLKKGGQLSDHPDQVEIRYDKAIRQVLGRAWQKDVVVRTVHLPPFDPEWIAGVIRAPNGYRAFELQASSMIWGASHHPERDLPKIRAIYREKPISDSLAERIAAIWRAVLEDRGNYGKDPGIYLDTSELIFFVGFHGGEHLTASTLLPNTATKSRQLWDISVALLDHVEGKSSVDALERIVRKGAQRVSLK